MMDVVEGGFQLSLKIKLFQQATLPNHKTLSDGVISIVNRLIKKFAYETTPPTCSEDKNI